MTRERKKDTLVSSSLAVTDELEDTAAQRGVPDFLGA